MLRTNFSLGAAAKRLLARLAAHAAVVGVISALIDEFPENHVLQMGERCCLGLGTVHLRSY
jgi:hypothetical protein